MVIQLKERLAEKVGSLKPPYNEVARAYYLEERSPKEIAVRYGRSVKTVQTQIYRAREMLKKIYGKEETA